MPPAATVLPVVLLVATVLLVAPALVAAIAPAAELLLVEAVTFGAGGAPAVAWLLRCDPKAQPLSKVSKSNNEQASERRRDVEVISMILCPGL